MQISPETILLKDESGATLRLSGANGAVLSLTGPDGTERLDLWMESVPGLRGDGRPQGPEARLRFPDLPQLEAFKPAEAAEVRQSECGEGR